MDTTKNVEIKRSVITIFFSFFCAIRFAACKDYNSIENKYVLDQDTFPISTDVDHPRSKLIHRPKVVSAKYMGGGVIKSNKSLKANTNCTFPFAQYGELKFGFLSEGNRWKDIVYGMPYYGIGIGFFDYSYKDFGQPISAFLFQGATLKAFSTRSRLKYEWNFGCSFNWDTYDPINNPTNESVGAKANIYFAANLFLAQTLSKDFDIEVGLALNHVSNGATKTPNSGLNTVGAFVSLNYYIDRERIRNEWNPSLRAPVYERSRLISDIAIHPTIRQRKKYTDETGLSTKYINHNFFVFNASYALLHMPVYKYRYGVGVDFIYDESAGFTATKIGETPEGREIAQITYGKVKDRFSVGLSLRGDIVMPKYSVYVKAGYNVVHNNSEVKRLYQAFGVKAPFWKNVYGSFSIQARRCTRAEYMFLGLGMYIDHRPFTKN